MRSQSRTVDYHRLTKSSVAFGVFLFAIAALGEFAGSAFFEPLPAWESALLGNVELVGVAIAFTAPFVFGIVLPLVESSRS